MLTTNASAYGTKRTKSIAALMSANDPQRTLPLALSSASEDPLRLATEWRIQLLLAK